MPLGSGTYRLRNEKRIAPVAEARCGNYLIAWERPAISQMSERPKQKKLDVIAEW